MLKTVVVARTGSPFQVAGGGARGERDTEPVVRHLAARGDLKVVYFGQISGAHLLPPNVHVIDTRMQDLPGGAYKYLRVKGAEISDHLDPKVAELRETNPHCWVELFGPTSTWSWVENPNRALCQQFGVLYGLPTLYAQHMLGNGAPRYGIVTDPKCYTRDGELATCWPECIPKAVLSQEQRTWGKVIQTKPFTIHAVYSGCEYWLTDGMESWTNGFDHDCHIAANAHLGEARLPKGREDLWSLVFSTCDRDETRVCGSGWEKHSLYSHPDYQDFFVGRFKTFEDTMDFISRGATGVMIPQTPGFNSTKIRLYALAGSLPRPFGDGEHLMTYDRDARVLPLDHPARWVPGVTTSNPEASLVDIGQETIETVLSKTRPDFTLLDRLIDEPMCRYPETDWLETYGGYVPC